VAASAVYSRQAAGERAGSTASRSQRGRSHWCAGGAVMQNTPFQLADYLRL